MSSGKYTVDNQMTIWSRIAQRVTVLTLGGALLLAATSCSGNEAITTTPGTERSDGSKLSTNASANNNTTAAVAESCTRDAQASIFRPANFSSLVNRSVLVVVGQVTNQSVDVLNLDRPASTPLPDPPPSTRVDHANVQLPPATKSLDTPKTALVTWVDSTINVESVLFAAQPDQQQPSLVVRTMADGPTCDRRDALPLKDRRYVLFLDTLDVAADGTQRYYTTGGSWSGRFTVDGETLQPDSPSGIAPSPASTQVAARELSALPGEIARARQPK